MRENPIDIELLLVQLAELNIIQAAAVPMVLLVLLEWGLSYYQKKDYYHKLDTLSAAVIGLVNIGLSAALKITIVSIIIFFYNLVPWSIPNEWWSYVLCIIAIDFCSSFILSY